MGIISTTTSYSTAPRTLIADDQPDVLEALRLLLKGEGYQTEAVTSPAAVLEALEARDFDLLLMDLNYTRDTTSGREGLDLLSRIQALDNTLPVIVMTAWGNVELAVEAMHRGVRDFVQKPWNNARLLTTLRTQIKLGRASRKRQRLESEEKILSGEILEVADLQLLLKLVVEHLQKALRNRAVVIFTKAPHDQTFCAMAEVGTPDTILGNLKFETDSRLLTMMGTAFDVRTKDLPLEEKRKLRKASSTFIVPIKLKGELIGFISLGSKLSYDEYDAEDLKFLSAVVDQIGAGINNVWLRGQQREFEEAREIQQGLLPKEIPQIRGYEIFGDCQPACAVGGDYFDILKFSDGKVALSIADVSGKGMPAALLMSNLQAAVKAFASETVPPKELCAKVNRVICGNMTSGKFITFFYGLLNAADKRLVYTNAGHNAPILLRPDGSHVRLREGGPVLGVFLDSNYEQGQVELATGDRVVLFTDGVTEAKNSEGEEFGEERLIRLLVENRELSAAELQKRVLRAVAEFSGGAFQDDATLIIMSVE